MVPSPLSRAAWILRPAARTVRWPSLPSRTSLPGRTATRPAERCSPSPRWACPNGGGRVISLFSHEKLDSLTVEYRDANGGLHGVVFTMPLGQAEVLKKQLVALGAHASICLLYTS